MEQEEPGQAVAGDQPQLLLEPRAGLVPVGGAGVAALELVAADAREGGLGGLAGVGEVGVGVAQVVGEVEAAAVGHLAAAADRVRGEAGGGLGGRAQHRLVVPAPLGLARLEGGVASGSRRARPAGARGGGEWAWTSPVATVRTRSRSASSAEQPVAAGVAAHVRALQLDREPVAAEDIARSRRASSSASRSRPSATGRATAPWRAQPERQCRPSACRATWSSVASGARRSSRVGGGDQPAQVAVAAPSSTSRVRCAPPCEGDLAAGDRPDADLAGGVGEGQRSRQAVVVGQGDRVVAERGRARRQLLGLGGAVQEREAGVGVELGVGHL